MPMTSAERQRLYRQRLKEQNPQKFEELRLKNLNRIKKTYVKVSKLSENEKSIRRRNWRKLKKSQIRKNTSKDKTKKSAKEYQRCYKRLKKENEKQKTLITKQIRKIKALQKKIYRQKILLDCQMLPNTSEQMNPIVQEEPNTPNFKTNQMVGTLTSTSTSEQEKMRVKKVILDNLVISETIKQEYFHNKKFKKTLRKIICRSKIIQKYKIQSRFGRVIGVNSRIRNLSNSINLVPKRKNRLAKIITLFYLRDDVSRASAGKKETKTHKKQKHQKRYLLDTMTSLRKKFKEDTGINASFSTFRRHKPFYVVKPRLSDRETCVCKIHANIEYKFLALKKILVFDRNVNLIDILEDTVCDKKSKECMYSDCNVCKEISPNYNFTKTNINNNVTWLEWTTKNVEYQKNNETKITKKVVSETKTGKLESLLCLFEKELIKFKEHHFNIWHQYNIYRNLKSDLQNHEVMIHCDFSENYSCKMHRQIQAVHFGSQNQISLHTSVIYVKDLKPQSYCTLSGLTDHSPAAIWAHLRPILIDIRKKYPEIDTVHMFSDGPATQYRQKKNFYLFKSYLEDLDFKKGTWNYSEAYHGKGAADGVGGVIKRLLDSKVSHGIDILNTAVAYSVLREVTHVNLFCVNESDISDINIKNQTAFEGLMPIPNTLKIHQIQVEPDNCSNEVKHRVLSCFCNSSGLKGFCDCFETKIHLLLKPRPKKRVWLSSSSDSDDRLHLVSKKRSANLSSFSCIAKQEVLDSSVTIRKPVSPSKKSENLSTFDNTGDSDSDDLQIFNLPHSGGKTKTSVHKIKTTQSDLRLPENFNINNTGLKFLPATNKENFDTGKDNIVKLNKKAAPVTILSDIRVNYSVDNLRQIMSSKKHNVASYNLKKDFPDICKPSTTVKSQKLSFFDSSSESE